MPSETQTTRVTALRNVAPGVRELTLEAPPRPIEFVPGQWISLHLPVGEKPPLVRAYSLAAAPVPSGELALCFDRVPDGLGSRYLFGLKVGDEVVFAGPLGNFVIPAEAGDLLWLARYTGIVPFRAMLQQLTREPGGRRVTLLYSAARSTDLAYLDELRAVAGAHPWFELHAALDTAEPGWSGDVGSSRELTARLAADRAGWTPMICGKREFVRPLRDYFYGLGYDRRAVKWENYD